MPFTANCAITHGRCRSSIQLGEEITTAATR